MVVCITHASSMEETESVWLIMLLPSPRRVLRYFAYILAYTVLLLAFVTLSLRYLSVAADFARPTVTRLAAAALKHPVSLQRLRLTWSGFTPQLELDAVAFLSKNHQSLLTVKQLILTPNLWKSLILQHWQWRLVIVRGGDLTLQQSHSKTWQVLGVERLVNTASAPSFGHFMQSFVARVMAHRLVIEDFNWTIKGQRGSPLYLRHISIVPHLNTLVVLGSVGNDHSAPFRIVGRTRRVLGSSQVRLDQLYFECAKITAGTLPAGWNVQWQGHVINLSAGALSAKLWATVSAHGALDDVAAQLALTEAKISDESVHALWQIPSVMMDVFWQPGVLVFNQLRLTTAHGDWPTRQMVLLYNHQHDFLHQHWYVDALPFQLLRHDVLRECYLPASLLALQKDGQIDFMLKDLSVSQRISHQSMDVISAQATVDQGAWAGSAVRPAISGIHGNGWYQDGRGVLEIDSKDLMITSPTQHGALAEHGTLHGMLHWYYKPGDAVFDVERLDLETPMLSLMLSGQHTFDSNRFNGHFLINDLPKTAGAIMDGWWSPTLTRWVKSAFKAGRGKGQFQMDVAGSQRHFKLDAKLDQLELQYHPRWPAIAAPAVHVILTDQSLDVNAPVAQSQGLKISNLAARITQWSAAKLQLQAQVTADAALAFSYLDHTPWASINQGHRFVGRGPLDLALHLATSLAVDGSPLELNGSLGFDHTLLELARLGVSLDKVTGRVRFANNHLATDNLQGELLGQPWSLTLDTQQEPDGVRHLHGHFKGTVDNAMFKDRGPSWLRSSQGQFLYHGQFDLMHQQGHGLHNHVSVAADMRGFQLDLPAPFGKSAASTRKLSAAMTFSSQGALHATLHYGKRMAIDAALMLDSGVYRVKAAHLHFGDGPLLPAQHGITVDGFLPTFSYAAWQPIIDHWSAAATPQQRLLPPLNAVNLEIKSFSMMENHVDNLYAIYARRKGGSRLSLSSMPLKGVIDIPEKVGAPWQLNFSRLHVLLPSHFQSRGSDFMASMPAMRVHSAQTELNHKQLGMIRFEFAPKAHGYSLDQGVLSNPDYNVKFHLGLWCHDSCHSFLRAKLRANNLYHFQRQWQFFPVIAKGYGVINIALAYPGQWRDFKLKQASGRIYAELHAGALRALSNQAESAISAARVLNIFSLQSLPRTLVSGFTSLGEPGLEFDRLIADVSLNQGQGSIKQIRLFGPVAWIQARGLMDFNLDSLYLKMHVVPNMTSSLPVLIGLAGGPVAGAFSWVANEVFAPKIGELAAKEYTIQGSMNHPAIHEVA